MDLASLLGLLPLTPTVTLVRAVMIKIVVTGVIVTVMVTIIGGMECGPEMKVNKKDPILSIKIQATTILDFQALLAIKDQVLMLLFLRKKMLNTSHILTEK